MNIVIVLNNQLLGLFKEDYEPLLPNPSQSFLSVYILEESSVQNLQQYSSELRWKLVFIDLCYQNPCSNDPEKLTSIFV